VQYISGETLRLNGTYRYVRVRSYACTGQDLSDLSDGKLLQMVMEAPAYDSLFVGSEGSDDLARYQGRGRHGPFDLSRLTPDLYERISLSDFRNYLRSHLDDPFYIREDGPVSTDTGAALNHIADSISRRSSRIFRLIINRGDEQYLSASRVHSDFDEYLFVEDWRNIVHFLSWQRTKQTNAPSTGHTYMTSTRVC